MPKSHRSKLKRKLRRARENNIDNAQKKITEVGTEYEDDYPDRFDQLSTMIALLDQVKEMLELFEDSI